MMIYNSRYCYRSDRFPFEICKNLRKMKKSRIDISTVQKGDLYLIYLFCRALTRQRKFASSRKTNCKPTVSIIDAIFHLKKHISLRPIDHPREFDFLNRIQCHLMHLIRRYICVPWKWVKYIKYSERENDDVILNIVDVNVLLFI